MLGLLIALPLAWLLGTFPTAGLAARLHGVDITQVGSGNPGASNIMRAFGVRAFVAVMLVDFSKGAISAGVGLFVWGRPAAYLLGVAAVLGHMFPLYRKGGKGVATAGGMVVVLFPLITLGLAVVWALIGLVLHKASLASLTVAVAYPVLVAVTGYEIWEVVVTSAIAVLVILRHRQNIVRLARGEESDFRAPSDETESD